MVPRLVRNLPFARVVRSCKSLDTLWLTAPSDRVSDDLGPDTAWVTVLYILGFLVLEAKLLAVVERASKSGEPKTAMSERLRLCRAR